MNHRTPLARLMTMAFHLNLATAAAMVLWTAWTGYLVATGQIRPQPQRATPALDVQPVHLPARAHDCPCQAHPSLRVHIRTNAEAA